MEIPIDSVSYEIFEQMMIFLYSGELEVGNFVENQIRKSIKAAGSNTSNSSTKGGIEHVHMAVDYLVDFLRVADEYLLDDLKNLCQKELIELIDEDTYQSISEMGELFNADRIVEYCQWYKRRKVDHYSIVDQFSPSVAEMSDDSLM